MAPRTDFPPVRACLFDMDGLLLDTEDIYTLCVNELLREHKPSKHPLPWSIKAQLQGRPGPAALDLFHNWADLPISREQYKDEYYALQAEKFKHTTALPGVEELLQKLGRTRFWELKKDAAVAKDEAAATQKDDSKDEAAPKENAPTTTNGAAKKPAQKPHRVHIALATSSHEANFRMKTNHIQELFSVFETHRRVLGDDPRIPEGRGKPLPDIYLIALKTINDSLPEGEKPITPKECLVFEDSIPGVEAGRRAGMRVVWCPHPMLKQEVDKNGEAKLVLAGLLNQAEIEKKKKADAEKADSEKPGEIDDGWADYLPTLIDFPYEKYGIQIPDEAVDKEPSMKESAKIDKGEVLQAVETKVVKN
ncbi:HAD-like domain-containing protein [Neurospora tetraspora]|uniref:HAD-like domain-containing protein n=1 Tax=Neurospora tetraspora TaxID=94610 RepID=A0AAE0J7U6_9PEZI|nr:HAD-like domain-containing protein [Neurospora tetraspora]